MKLKNLFSASERRNIAEKQMRQVLVVTICSILLCMGCLIGTTWAWFSLEMENKDNVIEIARNPEIQLTVNGIKLDDLTELPVGKHTVNISHIHDVDDLQQRSILYVTLILDETRSACIMLGGQHSNEREITVVAEKDCRLSWTVSWFAPGNAEALTGDQILVSAEVTTIVPEDTTEPVKATDPPEETTAPVPATTEPATQAEVQ